MVRVSMAQRARQDRDDVRVGVFVGWGGGAYFFLQDCTAFRTPKNHPPTPSPFISRYLYYLIFFFLQAVAIGLCGIGRVYSRWP